MPAVRSADLIGREAELTELSAQLGLDAPAGHPAAAPRPSPGRFALLAGDAGVGKTRLLMALRDRAQAAGWQVVAGHCLDLADSSVPYLPFSEILGRLMTPHPATGEQGDEQHRTLARLLPGYLLRPSADGAAPTTDADRPPDRGSIFTAVHDLLARAASRAPLLVVVEDAHWADESTRDLISYLFSRPAEGLAVVVSYRTDDLHRRHPLRQQVAEWARLSDVGRVQVDALDDKAVRELARALHGGALSERDYVSIVERAQGNPFFVEELVASGWSGPLSVELADLLLVRLDRLDDDTRHVVRLVSVAGRMVSHELLAEVSGLDPGPLEHALRAAVEANVLTVARQETYAFRHALLGEAVYDDLLPGERTRFHETYVSAIASGRARGTAAELAQHARRAGDLDTAIRGSIEAGDAAAAVGGASEAANHYLTAMKLTAASPTAAGGIDQTQLALRCAAALTAAGRVSKSVKILRSRLEALEVSAPDRERGQLLTEVAAGLLLTDTTESPGELARTAVSLLRNESPRLLARALAVQAQCLGVRDVDTARKVAFEARSLAEQHGLTSVVVEVNTTLAGLGAHDQSLEAWRAAAHQASEAGLIASELRARYFIGRALYSRGDVAAAAETYHQVITRAAAAGLPWSPFAAEARLLLAKALTHLGRLDEAWRLLDVSGQGPPMTYEWLYFAQQMFIHVGLRGRDHNDALERLRDHWEKDGLTAITAGAAELLRADARGDVATARAVYEEVVAHVAPLWHEWFQARLRLSTYVIGTCGTAALTQSTQERIRAREGVDRLVADGACVIEFYSSHQDSRGPEYLAWVARRHAEHLRWRWAAQIDPPEADELVEAWREAATLMEACDVTALAHTRARLAAVLRATGDLSGARVVADLARATAHELRLRPILDELTASGATPAPTARGQASALTPRETEILALVAQGRTNGEIGKQLFIATKTVSVHVSHILSKLGASSRTEAAAIAQRRRLL